MARLASRLPPGGAARGEGRGKGPEGRGSAGRGMKLSDLLSKSMVVMDLKARDKKGAIREVVQRLVHQGKVPDEDAKKVERQVHKREGQGSTGIGKGLAIPHAKGCPQVEAIYGVFGRSMGGIPFDAV